MKKIIYMLFFALIVVTLTCCAKKEAQVSESTLTTKKTMLNETITETNITEIVETTAISETSSEAVIQTPTIDMFKTKDGEYFDMYRLKQVIEEDTKKECKISDFTATDEIIRYNDAFDEKLQVYECYVTTDSWANGKWQLQRHFGEKITKKPKNGYAFPLYVYDKLEEQGTILAWKVDDDISLYVEDVDFESLDKFIPSKEDIDKDGVEDKMWKDVVAYTKYRKLPKGQENDFEVKKYLAVQFIYESRINGMNTIPYIDKCEAVKDFLIKKIYKRQ